jgi:hypothetical protein
VGGRYSHNGSGTIDSSIIDNNKATAFGGAGIIHQSGTLSITNSSITNNEVTGKGGGGIYNGGTLTIAGTTFSGNKASDATSSFSGGGAIYTAAALSTSLTVRFPATRPYKKAVLFGGSVLGVSLTAQSPITRPTQTPTTVSMTMAVAYSANLLRSP